MSAGHFIDEDREVAWFINADAVVLTAGPVGLPTAVRVPHWVIETIYMEIRQQQLGADGKADL